MHMIFWDFVVLIYSNPPFFFYNIAHLNKTIQSLLLDTKNTQKKTILFLNTLTPNHTSKIRTSLLTSYEVYKHS